jgi:tetratricopeptide (TPR) repeat protein
MRRLLSVAVLSIFAAWCAPAQTPEPAVSTDSSTAAHWTFADAQQLAAQGRLDQSLNMLNQLAAQTPVQPGVERLRAMIYYQKELLEKAADGFSRAIAQDPNDREAIEMAGITLYRLGRPADALPYLEKANTAVESANIEPQYALGLCYLDLGRFDDARRAFAAQYGFPADSAAAHLLAARLFLRHNNRDQAVAEARKALETSPTLPHAHLLLGEIALTSEDIPGAIQEFDAERAINPLAGEVYDRLGDAYMRAGRYPEALQALNRAVLLEPTATGPYILLGQTLLRTNQPIQALQYLVRAEKMDPSNSITHNLLGQAYRATGQVQASNREFQLVMDILHPNEAKPANK